jgi:glycerol uptake facilitator-like aquaporin
VTVARAVSDTFAGIAPSGAPAFILAQLIGMLLATTLARWLWQASVQTSPPTF